MNETEQRLAIVLLDIWPRCVVCGKRAEYRPRNPLFQGWRCEQHLDDYPERRDTMERAAGYEAISELELVLAVERSDRDHP
jgi:hypothetical protein